MTLVTFSCSFIYGIKKPKLLTDAIILSMSSSVGIPPGEKVAGIDTAVYMEMIHKIEKQNKTVAHDFIQPMMIKFFIDDTLNSYMVNCYVQGFPKLHWKETGFFDSIPPVNKFNLHYTERLVDEMKSIKILSQSTIEHKKYTILVYWSEFMEKQSKGLIENSRNFLLMPSSKEIEIIYINIDNLYVE